MGTNRAAPMNPSVPRCFFQREYRYRSFNAVAGVIILLVLAGFSAFLGRLATPQSGTPVIIRIIAWTLVAAFALGAGRILLNLLGSVVRHIRITAKGIEQNGRVRHWDRIAGVGGTTVDGGILIQYQKRAAGRRSRVAMPITLMTTPALQRAEFDALMRVLSDHLGAGHRHVTINPVPRWED